MLHGPQSDKVSPAAHRSGTKIVARLLESRTEFMALFLGALSASSKR
jgi:hypothetical protein